jgi:hypothetical protein
MAEEMVQAREWLRLMNPHYTLHTMNTTQNTYLSLYVFSNVKGSHEAARLEEYGTTAGASRVLAII